MQLVLFAGTIGCSSDVRMISDGHVSMGVWHLRVLHIDKDYRLVEYLRIIQKKIHTTPSPHQSTRISLWTLHRSTSKWCRGANSAEFPDSRWYGFPHRPGVGQLGAATIMENHGTVILFDIIVCIIIFLCNHNPENYGFIGAATIIAETNRTMAFDGM